MDLSIPAAGMASASAAFETAANNISTAFINATSNPLSAGSTMSDSVSLSTTMAELMKSQLDFSANVQTAIVDNQMNQSMLSVLG